MKRTSTFIPTLIALTAACAAAPTAQAQAPARQAFPWSSARAAQTASPAVSQTQSRLSTSAQQFRGRIGESFSSTVESATNIASNAQPVGDTIYLDEQGNQITRQQMQDKLSAGNAALESTSEAIQSYGQNLGQKFEQRVKPLRSVDTSAWGKAKSMTVKATSLLKKPSLLKAPEGITLPSMNTTWAKPKFAEPTTWFSRKTTSPITFAEMDVLPRKGKIPTSIDGPLTSPRAQFAGQSGTSSSFPSYQANSFENLGEAATKSILSAPDYEVAESIDDNSFDPRR